MPKAAWLKIKSKKSWAPMASRHDVLFEFDEVFVEVKKLERFLRFGVAPNFRGHSHCRKVLIFQRSTEADSVFLSFRYGR
jgi:hypothetical protein